MSCVVGAYCNTPLQIIYPSPIDFVAFVACGSSFFRFGIYPGFYLVLSEYAPTTPMPIHHSGLAAQARPETPLPELIIQYQFYQKVISSKRFWFGLKQH